MEQAVRIQRVNNWYWDLSQFKFLVRLHGEYNIQYRSRISYHTIRVSYAYHTRMIRV